jgi:nitrate reductase gamma subunit
MALGILRLLIIMLINIFGSLRSSAGREFSRGETYRELMIWTFSLKRLFNTAGIFSVISFTFHVGLIVVPLFLLEHIILWENGTGLRWVHLPGNAADILTLLTVITGILLLLYRAGRESGRFISSYSSYFLLIHIVFIFGSGYIASTAYNPISYTGMMIWHVLAGNLLLVLIPFTRLSHAFIYPIIRIVTLTGWSFPYNGGKRVNKKIFGSEQIEI